MLHFDGKIAKGAQELPLNLLLSGHYQGKNELNAADHLIHITLNVSVQKSVIHSTWPLF